MPARYSTSTSDNGYTGRRGSAAALAGKARGVQPINLSHLDPTAFSEEGGECILVGLTIDETHEHLRYFSDRDAGRDTSSQVRRNRYLHGKHEVARHLMLLRSGL